MEQLHRTSTPIHASVMLVVTNDDGDAICSTGVVEASSMGYGNPEKQGEWYLNRLKTQVQGQGYGSKLMKAMQSPFENE